MKLNCQKIGKRSNVLFRVWKKYNEFRQEDNDEDVLLVYIIYDP